MKVIFTVIFMFLATLGFSNIPEGVDTCQGVFQVVVHKGDTIAVDCDRMVLMNAETFAKYYHDSRALEELREDVPQWAATIYSIKAAHEENRLQLDSIASIRHQQWLLEKESKEEVIDDLIDAEEKNANLRAENGDLKKSRNRWRLIGGGSSGLSLLLLLILL